MPVIARRSSRSKISDVDHGSSSRHFPTGVLHGRSAWRFLTGVHGVLHGGSGREFIRVPDGGSRTGVHEGSAWRSGREAKRFVDDCSSRAGRNDAASTTTPIACQNDTVTAPPARRERNGVRVTVIVLSGRVPKAMCGFERPASIAQPTSAPAPLNSAPYPR
jgi:hypothetical protein